MADKTSPSPPAVSSRGLVPCQHDGWSCQEVAAALLLNDDTIRGWLKLFEQRGIEVVVGIQPFKAQA